MDQFVASQRIGGWIVGSSGSVISLIRMCLVSAANKDLTSQVGAFMAEMVCRYTLVAISQQAGNTYQSL